MTNQRFKDHQKKNVMEKTNNHPQTITLNNLDQAKDLLIKVEENRAKNLQKLGENEAKQFTALVASVSRFVQAQAKKEGEVDRRKEWIEFLEEEIKKCYQNKDIGAVLTYMQNVFFTCEQLFNEDERSCFFIYSRRMLDASVLHERLKQPRINEPLAVRAKKYIHLAASMQELECLIAVIEKDALYQFNQKNFEASVANHKTILEARKRVLLVKDFLSTDENVSSKLKISQFKTLGNLVAALAECKQVEESLAYYAEGLVLTSDKEVSEFLNSIEGHRALAGLYMNASSSYNQKKEKETEKDLLEKALALITENEEKDEEENNAKNALFRRRIKALLALNKEKIWESSSEEYQNQVRAAVSMADEAIKECQAKKETADTALHLEEAIVKLEELHAIDLLVPSGRFVKFCQLCGDLHRRAQDAPTINRYWYNKAMELLRAMQQDDLMIDLNDLAMCLFFISLYDRDTNLELSITYQRQSVFLFEQLEKKGKIHDRNNLAMSYYNLAVNLAKKNEAEEAGDFAYLALQLWTELVEKANRKDLQNLLEPCKKLIEWADKQQESK